MIENGRAVEVSFHAAGHTHLGVRLISRNAQLWTENGNFEILGALITKVHLSVLRELDGAPDHRAPSEHRGQQATANKLQDLRASSAVDRASLSGCLAQ